MDIRNPKAADVAAELCNAGVDERLALELGRLFEAACQDHDDPEGGARSGALKLDSSDPSSGPDKESDGSGEAARGQGARFGFDRLTSLIASDGRLHVILALLFFSAIIAVACWRL